jgi:hypothetical protein
MNIAVQSTGVAQKSRGRVPMILAAAVFVKIVAYGLIAPGNATLGYHTVAVVFPLVTHWVILIAIAAIISAARRKSKNYMLRVFAWLFLAAGLLDLGVAGFRAFVVEPEVRRALEEIDRR